MSYQFPPDVEQFIRQQMAAGDYRSEDDLLRDALAALGARQSPVIEEDPAVIEGIRRGLADMKAGRSRPLSEFDAQFRAGRNICQDG